jgi:hypothetical protein
VPGSGEIYYLSGRPVVLLAVDHQHSGQEFNLVIVSPESDRPRQEGQILKHAFRKSHLKWCLFWDTKFHATEIVSSDSGICLKREDYIAQPKRRLIDSHNGNAIALRKTHIPRPLAISEMLNPAIADHVQNQRNGERQDKMLCRIIPGAFLVCGVDKGAPG